MNKTASCGRFLNGDLCIEGSCSCFQGHILAIKDENGQTLHFVLHPYAEKTADGTRWILSENDPWALDVTVKSIREISDNRVVFTNAEGETVTLFAKGHKEQLNYDELKKHSVDGSK